MGLVPIRLSSIKIAYVEEGSNWILFDWVRLMLGRSHASHVNAIGEVGSIGDGDGLSFSYNEHLLPK